MTLQHHHLNTNNNRDREREQQQKTTTTTTRYKLEGNVTNLIGVASLYLFYFFLFFLPLPMFIHFECSYTDEYSAVDGIILRNLELGNAVVSFCTKMLWFEVFMIYFFPSNEISFNIDTIIIIYC